jgi:L-ascorbate metabolism protein UlaG (beta-lactamase superfamily)
MVETSWYVKPNVRIQGLVNKLCGWLHTLAPVPGAMNLANLHIPMLESFIADPQVHADAVANPKMKGGFFLDVDQSRVNDIRELLETIKTTEAATLKFAEAIGEAERMLRERASGYDLSPLYEQLPAPLRGVTEIVYDTDNHPQLRFLESLLYRDARWRAERQSIELSLDDGTSPPFVLSTPRLPGPGHLQLPLPLSHSGIDEFFLLRDKAQPLGQIREFLEISEDADEQELLPLLTRERIEVPDRTVSDGGRIRYYGHACLVLQSRDVTIMTDPFISSNFAAGDRFTYEDLPDHIDYVLITHGHQDHLVPESLLHIRGKVGVVVVPRNGSGQREDPSLRLLLENLGFTVREMDQFDELSFDGGTIFATPFLGEHCDLDVRAKSTYWVRVAGKTIFVGGDSSGLDAEMYRNITAALGPVDIGFLGMECDGAPLTWLYSSLFTQPVSRKMSITRKLSGSNAAQALDIVERLGIREAYVYAMGEEDWLQHIMATSYTPGCYQLEQVAKFLVGCAERGIPAEHLLTRKELRW